MDDIPVAEKYVIPVQVAGKLRPANQSTARAEPITSKSGFVHTQGACSSFLSYDEKGISMVGGTRVGYSVCPPALFTCQITSLHPVTTSMKKKSLMSLVGSGL